MVNDKNAVTIKLVQGNGILSLHCRADSVEDGNVLQLVREKFIRLEIGGHMHGFINTF